MNQCSEEGCKNPVWKNSSECALHCEKHDYSTDWNSQLLLYFYDSLVEYIIGQIKTTPSPKLTEAELWNCFARNSQKAPDSITIEKLSKQYIYFNKIWFPAHDARDSFDYTKILNLFGQIHFDNCTFSTSVLELESTEVFFQSCVFEMYWHIKNHKLLGNVDGFMYQGCTFREDVSTLFEEHEKKEIESPIFNYCYFKKEIYLENTKFNSMVFSHYLGQKDEKLNNLKIEINNCVFEEMFALSESIFESLKIDQSQFKSEFWLKSCKIKNLVITRTEFNASTDFEGSTFKKFIISRTVFKDFASFVDCRFGDPKLSSAETSTTFDFVTFLGFCSFRSSNFYQGLDLQNTSMRETPNFHGIFINEKLTDKETFRIIKNSFDKVGNYIEGNRFYKFEMLKHQDDLFNKDILSERILFWLYNLTSDFGQSIIRPILWFALTAIVYWLLIETKNVDLIFKLLPESTGNILNDFFMIFNSMTKYIIPYKTWLEPGMEFISFIFYC